MEHVGSPKVRYMTGISEFSGPLAFGPFPDDGGEVKHRVEYMESLSKVELVDSDSISGLKSA